MLIVLDLAKEFIGWFGVRCEIAKGVVSMLSTDAWTDFRVLFGLAWKEAYQRRLLGPGLK